MPTICELQIELKRLGVRGYSGKKKAQLEQMLNKAKSKKPEEPKQEPKQEPKPVALLGMKTEQAVPDTAPPLANKSLIELYKKIQSLQKRLDDNINPNEKKQTENTLDKYKIAYRYNRKKFMDSLKTMKKTELKKLRERLERQLLNTKDNEEELILRGQIAEIGKR
jgi:hypothetical protein